MRKSMVAPLALWLALAACSGNSLNNGTDDGGGDGDGDSDTSVEVPESLAENVSEVVYDPTKNLFKIKIDTLDTAPVLATWKRNARLDVPGYKAFSVQEDPLDRMFIGLASRSGDGSVTAAVASDGGQFNKFFSGGSYSRSGEFSRPIISGKPGSGQVSYAGKYAGLTNLPVNGPGEMLPVPGGTPDEVLPGQASRVTGDMFMNVSFSDNGVNGAVYNRMLVDKGFGLQSVILAPTTMATNGTFVGNTERDSRDDPGMAGTGDYGGVFGGEGAANVAGVLALEQIYTDDGEIIQNGRERGVFVLRQCGLSGDSPICDDVAPDF